MRTLAYLIPGVLLFSCSLAASLDQQVFRQVMDTVVDTGVDLDASEKSLLSVIESRQGGILVDDNLSDKVVSEVEEVVKSEQTGLASWYGKPFHGRRTASGEIYNMYQMTAAHKKLPLHSRIRVTNLSNNKFVTLKVNDRGPYRAKYILDVSYAAAKALGFLSKGITKVKVELLQ